MNFLTLCLATLHNKTSYQILKMDPNFAIIAVIQFMLWKTENLHGNKENNLTNWNMGWTTAAICLKHKKKTSKCLKKKKKKHALTRWQEHQIVILGATEKTFSDWNHILLIFITLGPTHAPRSQSDLAVHRLTWKSKGVNIGQHWSKLTAPINVIGVWNKIPFY